LIVFLKCYGIGVLFPGDVEGAGWRSLMATPAFMAVLRDTSILVASHHGRKSGWCDEVGKYCNPYYVVISDKGYMHESQETVSIYRSIAKGGPFRSQPARRVLTTRNDGRIGFTFTGQGWNPY
jgi:beta-lactamase superfamily II metal-dependent hydrolase